MMIVTLIDQSVHFPAQAFYDIELPVIKLFAPLFYQILTCCFSALMTDSIPPIEDLFFM